MENTGYKGYSTLLKITDDGTNRPLDVNNNLCSESGLPQDFKSNDFDDDDYVAPVYDETACPIPSPPDPEPIPYFYRRDGSQDSEPAHIPYVEYIDDMGNPAVFYADAETDICGGFTALEIVMEHYVTPC